jgi:hypothetical protein
MLRESRVHEFRREIELVVETCQLSSSRCTYSFNWGSHLRLQTVNLIYFFEFFLGSRRGDMFSPGLWRMSKTANSI